MDALSWAKRVDRYTKKFAAGRKYIPQLFAGFHPLPEIEQIALFGLGGRGARETIGGGKVVVIGDWIQDVLNRLQEMPVASHAVPEQFICLRTIQFVLHSRGLSRSARRAR